MLNIWVSEQMYYVQVVKKVYMYGMQPSLNTKSCIKIPFCIKLRFIHLYKNVHINTFMLLNFVVQTLQYTISFLISALDAQTVQKAESHQKPLNEGLGNKTGVYRESIFKYMYAF